MFGLSDSTKEGGGQDWKELERKIARDTPFLAHASLLK